MKNIAFENYLGAIINKKRGGAASAASTLNDDIVAFWKLDEASGTRVDSVGSNDLTDNNTVTQAVGKIGNAAQFTAANSENLSLASPATDLKFGDVDVTFASWVYLDSKAAVMAIMDRWQIIGTAKRQYSIRYTDSLDRFRFIVSPDNVNVIAVNADSLGAVSIETWYLIVAWHDSVNNEIGIKVNNGTSDTTAHSGGIAGVDTDFYLGSQIEESLFFNGRIDAPGVWTKVFTAAEHTEVWNDGAGKEYPF